MLTQISTIIQNIAVFVSISNFLFVSMKTHPKNLIIYVSNNSCFKHGSFNK